ncbi:MAG: glycosyltransferase family 4 protein [Ginsengibacter sp.]
MVDKHLHIVCLDVPYPVDHGGIFDLFYKIVALYELNIKIHLHCFEYGRGHQVELNKYCAEVIYYKRKRSVSSFSLSLPYIVNSRRNAELLTNLLKDDHPVLMEGIHCTYFLSQNKLLNKKVFVRLHNVESEYYKQLANSTTSVFKKMYFLYESRLLKKYEQKISSKATFIAVTLKDKEIYEKEFHVTDVKYLPVFLPFNAVRTKQGRGSYCLYHGNLGIPENEKAVRWLLSNVFNTLSIPFVVAGKNPSERLRRLAHQNSNTCLVENPADDEMNELISKAHINILPSFNSTGIKIKLLNALFNGRHCIVNAAAVDGTGLESLCCIAKDSASFKININALYKRVFTNEDIKSRKQILLSKYDNEQNAGQLIQWIY